VIKYILLFGCFFVFKVNAQNAVSVHLENVVCQLKSYRSFKYISDSLENRIRIYDDSIRDLYPNYCTIGGSVRQSEKWLFNYNRMSQEQEELLVKYNLIYDSLNNEIRIELKRISEQYCILNKIDLFFASSDPPIFGIMPKDVSEDFAAYILSLK